MKDLDLKFRAKDKEGRGLSSKNLSNLLYDKLTNVNLFTDNLAPVVTESSSSNIDLPNQFFLVSSNLFKKNYKLYNWNASGLSDFFVSKSLSNAVKIVFFTDAKEIEFSLIKYNSRIQIRVNNNVVSTISTDASGTAFKKKLEFSDYQLKKIEICGINMPIESVRIDKRASLINPNFFDNSQECLAFGDSYIQGVGANHIRDTIAGKISDVLSLEMSFDGIGGAGWLSTNPNNIEKRFENILELTKVPDIVITGYGYNDAGGNMSIVKSNYNTFSNLLKSLNSKVRILTLSPWTPIGSTENLTLVKNALVECCNVNGNTFVDIENIVNAQNKYIYTDIDNVHPNQLGHTYLGIVIAHILKRLL